MITTIVVGAINWDTTMFVDRFPHRGEEVVVREITYAPGGKGGNAAVASARLLGRGRTAIIGAVGTDWIATEHSRIFQREGVDVTGMKHTDGIPSGQAHIIVDKTGENEIHTYFGANAAIMPQDIGSETCKRLLANAKLVTLMDPPFETSLKIARQAKKLGKSVAWDPGVKSQLGFDVTSTLIPYVDYFLANETEVRAIIGGKSREAAARKLTSLNPELKVIMKLGARGAISYDREQRETFHGLDLKGLGLTVANSVGCGDAFIGAFSAALTEGQSDAEALRWANCAAGLKATRVETRGSPDRTTLMKYLANCLGSSRVPL